MYGGVLWKAARNAPCKASCITIPQDVASGAQTIFSLRLQLHWSIDSLGSEQRICAVADSAGLSAGPQLLEMGHFILSSVSAWTAEHKGMRQTSTSCTVLCDTYRCLHCLLPRNWGFAQTFSLVPCAGPVCPNHRCTTTEAMREGFPHFVGCMKTTMLRSQNVIVLVHLQVAPWEYVKFVVAALEMQL